MLKKTILIFVTTLIFLSSITSVYAQEVHFTDTYSISDNVIEKNHRNQLAKYIESLNDAAKITRGGDDYYYLPSLVNTGYGTVTGYPDGQPAGGTRFTSGGSFYWDPSGGSKLDVSIGVSFGEFVAVSVSVGKVSNTNLGFALDVPDSVNHYKLQVDKVLEIKKYIIYEYDSVTDERVGIYDTFYTYTDYSYTLRAVKCNS